MIPKKTYPPARELAVLDQAKANRDTFPAETEHDLDLSELIVCNYTYAAETEHKWIKHIFFFPTFWIRKYSGGQNKKWVGGSKIELEPHILPRLIPGMRIYNFQIPRTTPTNGLKK